jgi:hypothetical protein
MAIDDRARSAGNQAQDKAEQAAQAIDAPWVRTLGKVGVAAIGLVHLLLAWLALQVAFGSSSGKSTDQTGALAELAQNGAGKALLGLMALGFLAWAVWQVVMTVIGFAWEDEKERTVQRVASAVKAVIGLSLAFQSVLLVVKSSAKSSSKKQQDWTASVLQWGTPGKVLVVLAGLIVAGVAAYLVYYGVKAEFLQKIGGSVSPGLKRLGQGGYIARGVVFGVLGLLMMIAGFQADPDKSRGLDAALKTLADQPYGTYLLTLVAVGLAGFGVFNLITAHRRVRP